MINENEMIAKKIAFFGPKKEKTRSLSIQATIPVITQTSELFFHETKKKYFLPSLEAQNERPKKINWPTLSGNK